MPPVTPTSNSHRNSHLQFTKEAIEVVCHFLERDGMRQHPRGPTNARSEAGGKATLPQLYEIEHGLLKNPSLEWVN
jgi:hypothetical protein